LRGEVKTLTVNLTVNKTTVVIFSEVKKRFQSWVVSRRGRGAAAHSQNGV